MNLFLRILSAVVLLPLVFYLLMIGGFAFGILIAVVFFLAFWEFTSMVLGNEKLKLAFLFSLMAGIAFVVLLNSISIIPLSVLLSGFCVLVGICIVLIPAFPKEIFEKIGVIYFGFFYVGAGLITIYWLRNENFISNETNSGIAFVILLCVSTWSNDTFAYIFGKMFGKHKINVEISPSKTWEGFIGGGIFTILLPLFLKVILDSMSNQLLQFFSYTDIFCLTLPIVIFAPLGDLMESRIKRYYNVKDSGKILPGHGGLFDRIDALLISSVWVFAYAFWIRPVFL